MPENNPSMKLVDMKKVLQQGKDRSMHCAYGTAKSGMALLLDLKRQGRMLQTELQSTQPGLQGPAFGIALRDETDANHLKFRVNKGVEGHAKKLAKTLRGTGIKRVTILFDEDRLFETADIGEEDATDAPGNPPAAPSAIRADMARVIGLVQASPLSQQQKTALGATLRTAITALDGGDPATATRIIAEVQASIANPNATGPNAPASPAPGRPATPPPRTAQPAPATPPAATPPATTPPVARPNGPTPAITAGMKALSDALRAASVDLKAAEALPNADALPADKQALDAALARIRAQRAAGDYAGAVASVAAARTAAITLKGKSLQLAEQQQTYDRMAKPLERVRNTYFTKANNDNLRREKLKPGKEFQDYLTALAEFERNPSLDLVDEIENTAANYLRHNDQLGPLDRRTSESKRKRQVCETALTQARHMRMALQAEQAGPPPWDEATALRAASIRAAFSFETMGQKAEQLPDGSSGASAAFWVKGWDDTAEAGGDVNASKRDFLFKPAEGESDVPGFPKGGSTPREAVTKSLTDKIAVMTGLDLGVPVTSVVALPPENIDLARYNDAMRKISGDPNGAPAIDPTSPPVGSLQQFAASDGALKDKDPAFLATIPQSECEKAAVLDILCLNTDRHAGNFMVGEQDGPAGKQPKLIPIDHGLALPTRDGLRKRGADRMNDLNGNALLKMPGSHQPFSADMQERLALLDPDAIERGINDFIDAVDTAHPGLRTKTHMPPETAYLAKRAARFLKRACTRLSPAMVQMALANRQADIFNSPDNAFNARADAVIADYEQIAPAMEDLCTNIGSDFVLTDKLRTLGWHNLSPNFSADYAALKAWYTENAAVVVAAYHNDTPWPGHPPKPEA